MAERAYFVIADVTGYTAFMTGSELDHAQDILQTLFNTLLDNIKPPLIISNFQGDAILTYAPQWSFSDGQTLLETVENLYVKFMHKLELMQNNTTCTCKACANMGKLDLKLFVRYGEYVVQDMRGKQELSGPDVIVAHRMMKNEVKEKTGLKAYTLFSEVAVNQLGLQDFTGEMKPHSEAYDHIGEVKMFAYCLKTMWERRRDEHRVVITPEETFFTVEIDVPGVPARVWEYLTNPELRLKMMGVKGITYSGVKNGRKGIGSVAHCAHGESDTAEFRILDWQPFNYLTEEVTGMPMGIRGHVMTQLEPTLTGTHITWRFIHPFGTTPPSRVAARLMRPMVRKFMRDAYVDTSKNLQRFVQEENTTQTVSVAVN